MISLARSSFLFIIIAVVAWLFVAFIRAPIIPVEWQAPTNPQLTGVFSPNNALASVETLSMPGFGPEDVACAADGSFVSGLADGRIVRWRDGTTPDVIANTGGRPLGMDFDATGRLIVADAQRGLLSMDEQGEIDVLVNQYRGRPLKFVDDLAIAANGTIWFSDASQRFGIEDNLLDFFEGSRTGRLLSYRPTDGKVSVHMDGLFFASGVTMGPNDNYVLVNETGLGRVQRYWLTGPKAHTADMFIEHLPGTPDNINFDGDDRFWIAMPSLRNGIDGFADKPFIRRLLSVLPTYFLSVGASVSSFVVAVDTQGQVVANLQDPKLGYHYITSATPCGGRLWLGSLQMSSVAQLPLINSTKTLLDP